MYIKYHSISRVALVVPISGGLALAEYILQEPVVHSGLPLTVLVADQLDLTELTH